MEMTSSGKSFELSYLHRILFRKPNDLHKFRQMHFRQRRCR